MPRPERSHALDHVVLVLFENRSLDNMLGHLYGPEDGKNFDGVIGKNLSNPIPEWAEHGAGKTVPYTVATDMDAPNPDSGEEYYHTNTQLFNILDEDNRFKIGEAVSPPWNAPETGAVPTMNGFVTDYISTFTAEVGRQPTYERDAANGALPDFSLIEPNMLSGRSDYHPAFGRSLIPDDMNIPMDPPSSIGGGEAFLASIYNTIRSAASPDGSNAYNTLFFIGWDEPGGTYDHVPPGPVPAPDPSAPAGQLDFTFDRSGYRVPAIIVSPWVDEGIVINDEHRHTSMIATLRNVWGLGDPFTGRDAAAATFDHLLSRETPRDPANWPDVEALPVPQFHMDMVQMGNALSVLGKTAGSGMLEHAKQSGIVIPAELTDPNSSPEQIVAALRSIALQVFPRLASHT